MLAFTSQGWQAGFMRVAYLDPKARYEIYTKNGDIVYEPPVKFSLYGGRVAVKGSLLTPHKLRALTLTALGLTKIEAGNIICNSPDTIKTHIAEIYPILGVHTIAHAVSRSFETGTFELLRTAQLESSPFRAEDIPILEGAARGDSREKTGNELGIPAGTVKSRRAHITKATGLPGIEAAVLLGYVTGDLVSGPTQQPPVAAATANNVLLS